VFLLAAADYFAVAAAFDAFSYGMSFALY